MISKLFLFILFISQLLFTRAQINSPIATGDIRGPFAWKSNIYPGTERDYWLYVPKQYEPSKPACLLVLQDGLSRAAGWNLPAVLDTLIAKKEIPVMIGLFIDHGKLASADTTMYPRFNRSFEYDGLGDRYARFLLEELIPEVSRSYNLSANPDDRSIAGASSGAICAFNVAWERPDAFRRVFSSIGTYVGLRGGDEFATLVRKTEPKPIRVFLQDGSNDNNRYGGDWWIANQNMLSALTWAGYEVNHAWGDGGHDSKHTITILADALRWLWKDYPAPVAVHSDTSQRFNPIIEAESWKEIPLKGISVNRLAVNKKGEIFFTDKQSVYRIVKGIPALYAQLKGNAGGISFQADGSLYAADLSQHKIVSIDEKRIAKDVLVNVNADFLTVTSRGIYFSETSKERIGFYSFLKKDRQYIAMPGRPGGLALTAEQSFLNTGVTNNVFGYSFKIMEDGRLNFGQAYIHYHIPYGETGAGTMGMATDTENNLYSATAMGIQVSEQLGKVNFIFSKPAEGASDVVFGGSNFNIVYVNCNGRLFSRKINVKGVASCMPAVRPSRPRL